MDAESIDSFIDAVGDQYSDKQKRKIRADLKITKEVELKIEEKLELANILKKNPAHSLVFDALSQDGSFIDVFLSTKTLDFHEYMKGSLNNPKDIYKDLTELCSGNGKYVETLFDISYLEGMISRGKGEIALSLLCQNARLLPLIGSDGDIEILGEAIEVKHSGKPCSSHAGRLSNNSGSIGNNGLLKEVDVYLSDMEKYFDRDVNPELLDRDIEEIPETGITLSYGKSPNKRLDKWFMEFFDLNANRDWLRDTFIDFFVFTWQNFFIEEKPEIREIVEMFTDGRSFSDMIVDDMSVIPTSRGEEFGKYMLAVYLRNYLKRGSLITITKHKDCSKAIYMNNSLIDGKTVYEIYDTIKDTDLAFGWPSIRKSAGKCVFGGVFVN